MTQVPLAQAGTSVKMTNVRWQIMFFIFLIQVLNYLDRVNISVAAPLIQKEFGFSPVELGVIFSSYTWGNLVGQIPGGALAQMFGARKLYVIAILFWSAVLAATTLAKTVTAFVSFRVAFGFFEGMVWPIAAVVAASWFPKSERSRAMSLQSNGMVVGLAIAPPFITMLMLRYGWRTAFFISALLGVVWTFFWLYIMREKPDQHPRVNSAELAHISENEPAARKEAAEKPLSFMAAMKIVLKKPSLYAVCISNFSLVWTLFTYTNWLPLYLQHERGFTISSSSYVAMLPFLFSMITIPCGGIVADWLYKKTGNLKLSRKLTIVAGLLAGGILMVPAALASNQMTGVVTLALGYSLIMFILGPQWAVPTEVGGSKAAGHACGVVQVLSGIAGIVAPLFMGYVVQVTGHYTIGVIVAGAVAVIGAICFPILYRGEKDHYRELAA